MAAGFGQLSKLMELPLAQTTIRDIRPRARARDDSTWPTVIVGAGPYGLAAAAYLRSAGIDTRVFGDPMEFWQKQMPAGMRLRSGWEACSISDPHRAFTLDRFNDEQGLHLSYPVLLERFIEYGRWFQRRLVPDLDGRRVKRIDLAREGFQLTLDDGELLRASRVVVAAGIAPFAWRPPQFEGLPREMVSHTSEHADLRVFGGRRVAVVGAGQSALESAALLHEGGAETEVIMRARQPLWIGQNFVKRLPKPYRFVFYPPTDVGPPGLNWLVAMPDLFRRLPQDMQDRAAYRAIRPMGGFWLRDRVEGVVKITTGTTVAAATVEGGKVRLQLDDGTERCVDAVLLGTGYRVDVTRYPFLTSEVLRSLRLADGYPELTDGLESSVPGLHFLGAPAARSFGPLMRFVSGTGYATRSLARRIARRPSVRR